VLEVVLPHAERDIADGAVDVAHVVEQYATDVLADKRETQLGLVKENGIAAKRESGGLRVHRSGTRRGSDIARACFVVREPPIGISAAAKKTFGKRNVVLRFESRGHLERKDRAEARLLRKDPGLA